MASGAFQPLAGTSDISSPEVRAWQAIEAAARRVFHVYGFEEIRTPVIEKEAVFTRSLGETTDVVQKEMYVFEDRGGRRVALRPEGTAGVMRYVCGAGPEAQDARLFYLGPMFRCERPQAGRKRQFHQVGVERIGEPNPVADAECIALQWQLLGAWGLEGAVLRVNTRGEAGDGPAVAAGLREALAPHREALCGDCRRRVEENVLRVLDCKQPGCRALADGLPPATSFMTGASRAYLDEVLRLLERLEVPAQRDERLVRGLDYYEHTVWEITHGALGAQDALSGGGRYRVTLGDRTVRGVGFAMGIERVVAALRGAGAEPADPFGTPRAWIVSASEGAREDNLVLLQALRRRGVACGMDTGGRSMKAQMRAAGRSGAAYVVLRGDDELARGVFALKDMATGEQREVALPELMERVLPGSADL